MSVGAHLTEMYFCKYKVPASNFRWLLVGCYFPDGMGLSKLLLVGTGNRLVHRDILFGWTHSLPVCGAVALAVGAVFGKRAGWSFAAAAWLHTIMDLGDPIGVKALFPFSDRKFSFAVWPWSDGDLTSDLLTYYSTPTSLSVELIFLCLALYACRRMTGTWNPIAATAMLWRREGWFDRPSEATADADEILDAAAPQRTR